MKAGLMTIQTRYQKQHFSPEVYTSVPPTPPDLDLIAEREWDRVTPILVDHGILSSVDINQLVQYCKVVSLVAKYETRIKESPIFFETPLGLPKNNPWVKEYESLTKTMFMLADHFGLSPKARGRVGLKSPNTVEKKDDFGEFIDGD